MSTQKDSDRNRIKSFADLASYRSEFSEDASNSSANLKGRFNFDIPNKSDIVKSIPLVSDPILKAAKENDKLYRISVHPNLKSKTIPKEKFSNFLKNIDQGEKCTAVRKLIEICGVECTDFNLPFQLDEEMLSLHDRHYRILTEFNIDCKDKIHKATYRNIISRDVFINKKKNNPIRYFFIKNGNDIEVILIDLHHLFATQNYKNYPTVSSYGNNVTKLWD